MWTRPRRAPLTIRCTEQTPTVRSVGSPSSVQAPAATPDPKDEIRKARNPVVRANSPGDTLRGCPGMGRDKPGDDGWKRRFALIGRRSSGGRRTLRDRSGSEASLLLARATRR
jgi:hypothetical protein